MVKLFIFFLGGRFSDKFEENTKKIQIRDVHEIVHFLFFNWASIAGFMKKKNKLDSKQKLQSFKIIFLKILKMMFFAAV